MCFVFVLRANYGSVEENIPISKTAPLTWNDGVKLDVPSVCKDYGCGLLYSTDGWRFNSRIPCGQTDELLAEFGFCACDSLCLLHGDCCYDFKDNCPEHFEEAIRIHPEILGECVPTAYFYDVEATLIQTTYHAVVTRCKNTDSVYSGDCATRIIGDISDVMVTDTTTNITYRNVYCALCNNVHIQNLASWQNLIDCIGDNVKNMTVSDISSLHNCSGANLPDKERVQHLRKCFPFASPCEIGDASSRSKCLQLAALAPIRVRRNGVVTDIYHKNRYCFMTCYENVTIQNVLNNGFILTEPILENTTFGSLYCDTIGYIVPQEPSFLGFSFRLFIDFSGQFCLVKLLPDGQQEHTGVCLKNKFIKTRDRQKTSKGQNILSFVCVSISIISLSVRICLHPYVPPLRTTAGCLQLLLSFSMLIWLLLFLLQSLVLNLFTACKVWAIVMHWFVLLSFFLMNMIGFDMYTTFSKNMQPGNVIKYRTLILYVCYAVACSTVIVGVAITIEYLEIAHDFRPFYGRAVCWVSNPNCLLIFVGIPVGLVVISNTVFLCLTVWNIRRNSNVPSQTGMKQCHVLIFMKLLFLMGLSWVFGYLAAFTCNEILWDFFIVTNASQGFILSLSSLTSVKVRHYLKQKFCNSAVPS